VGPEPKAAAAKPKPQEGQGPPVEVYAYNPAGKPDPFRPFGVAPAEKKQAKREPSSLRDMEVGQLKLVGIAQGPQGAVALVEDASGRGYVVSRGMRIGAAGGLVKDISAGGIRVEETLRSYTGRVQTRSVSLKLVPQEH
jgi:type IV pilus assembly protein PilP